MMPAATILLLPAIFRVTSKKQNITKWPLQGILRQSMCRDGGREAIWKVVEVVEVVKTAANTNQPINLVYRW